MGIKEQLETAIAGLKCVRSYYEAEILTFEYDEASHLPHPEDMIRHTSSVLESLHRALSGVLHEERRKEDS